MPPDYPRNLTPTYREIAWLNVNVAVEDPTSVQIVKGSDPICSDVCVVDVVAATGNVTGMEALHDPWLATKLAPVIFLLTTV